jgi:hypothetical protein
VEALELLESIFLYIPGRDRHLLRTFQIRPQLEGRHYSGEAGV